MPKSKKSRLRLLAGFFFAFFVLFLIYLRITRKSWLSSANTAQSAGNAHKPHSSGLFSPSSYLLAYPAPVHLRQPRRSPCGGQRPPRLSACLSAVPAAALLSALSAALLCPVSAAVLCAARPLPCAPPAHPLLVPEPPRRAPCAAPRSPRSCTPALSICHPRQGGHREVSALLCYASACFCARRNCRGSVGLSPAQRPRRAVRASCSASASSVSSAA